MDHLDCRFYLVFLSFSAPLSEVEKNMQGSVRMKEHGFGVWKGDEKGQDSQHNICDSEEDHEESNMPTNNLTPRSFFFIS